MQILSELKKRGYRLTKPRQEVLKALTSYPLSVQEIYASLQKKRIAIDLASVYRTLELFVEMGIVYAIDLGEDKKRYELVQPQNHHHHIVCNNCGIIEDVKFNETDLDAEILRKSQFKVDHHHLEFFGLCSSCQ